MDQATPYISIIVAVYNCVDHIDGCIQSVIAQTHTDVELIIIDGGSTGGATDNLRKHDASFAFWLSESDTGIYNAQNKAIPKARGNWILFLGADDELISPTVIEEILPRLKQAADCYNIAYGKVLLTSQDGDPFKELGTPWQTAKQRITQVMLPHTGVFHHTQLFRQRGLFDEQFKIAGDFEMILRELPQNDALFIDRIITRM
ncbi:MAG: glycosyltransferase involved in cell wall biosynthesis [Parasphingorhabdus sp.]|jgi:glycosyltransferase involved in cell wall biosynthesis